MHYSAVGVDAVTVRVKTSVMGVCTLQLGLCSGSLQLVFTVGLYSWVYAVGLYSWGSL